MCRFLVYKGSDEILLSKLILDPSHSILTQSFDSRLRLDMRRPHNGDGFGIGYYTDRKLGPEPCIFTSTTPAWNCINLQRIASKTASPLIFAHVRATTEGSLSDDNCHPFCHGSLMWMHNGGLGGWKHIKRRLGERLVDKWYLSVQGSTDSEWAFALYLDTLERMGYNPSSPPAHGFGPVILRQAMLKTIKQINDFIADIPEVRLEKEKVDTRSLLNFAVTDGHSVVCTRYVSSRTDEAASLYYSSGTIWDDKGEKGDYQMDRRDKGADIVLVASEPLTFERESWVTVPTNSILTIHKQTVMVHPIIDAYSNHNPYHRRSSKFVQDKGLVTNEKTPTLVATPSISPSPFPNRNTHDTGDIATTLLPSMHYSPSSQSPSTSPNPNLQHTSITPATSPLSSPVSLRPSTSTTTTDHRHPSQTSTRRPQEQHNVKKKRRSLPLEPGMGAAASENRAPDLDEIDALLTPDSPGFRSSSYGDPNKIKQYFPELDR